MSDPRCRWAVAAAAAALLAGTPAAAQWRIEASYGGVSHEAIAAGPASSSILLAVGREGPSWLRLSGAMPVDSAAVAWAAAGAGGELATRGAVELGVFGAGEGWIYQGVDDRLAHGVLAEAGPFARGRAGILEVEARTGAIHYRSDSALDAVDRTFGSAAILALSRPTAALSAGGEARYLQGPDGGFVFVGASAAMNMDRGSVWARAGRWLDDAIEGVEWEAGAYLRAADRVQVRASVRQDTNDPIFWSRPRRSWSVGISYSFGGRSGVEVPLVLPSTDGRTVLQIPVDQTDGAPTLAGDFSGWEPVAMTRRGDFWTAELALTPGIYRYAFRNAAGEWFLPSTVTQRVDDGFGGENGVLLIR